MATQNFDFISYIGSQSNTSPSAHSSVSGASWNALDITPEIFIDFESSSFDDDEDTSVVSGLHKASKKISKNAQGSSNQANQRRAKRARNPWTTKEDAKLMELMKKYGQSWAMISSMMEGRTGKQVRDRYLNKLRPNIKCGDWTATEDEKLVCLLKEVGNRWSLIATHLPGRTEGQVKNRFYSCIKKRLQLNGDFIPVSSVSGNTSSFVTSPQTEEMNFDFTQEFDVNMFNGCEINFNESTYAKDAYMKVEEFGSDQSTAQSPNSNHEAQSPFHFAMADPTDVISYDFSMPARTFSYGPVQHDSQIDAMLNKVTNYYVEKSAPVNNSMDVDSFFSDDLRNVAPAIAMEDDTERYMQLSKRKAYLELALAKTMNEIKGL